MTDEITDATPTPRPRPEPLFNLDLKSHGAGMLAPMNFLELAQWLDQEYSLWSSVRHSGDSELQSAGNSYHNARNSVTEAINLKERGLDYAQPLYNVQAGIQNAIAVLPYSQSATGRQVAKFRASVENDDRATMQYILTLLSRNRRTGLQIDNLYTWRAVIEATIERYNLVPAIPKKRLTEIASAFEDLRAEGTALISETRLTLLRLTSDLNEALASYGEASDANARAFDLAQGGRTEAFEKLQDDHGGKFEQIRKTFLADIALKAPAEYWTTKQKTHRDMAWVFGALSFVALAASAISLVSFIQNLLQKVQPNTAPELWRIGAIATFGVFVVWGVRLLVRMFLSHLHLYGDASERIVMVKTYLSLLEGDRLASSEDRQLILQALFRPASDGIVKDEAVPLSIFEALTRNRA